jgi:DNA-binding transcriptional ArsR family regulator
LEKLFKAKFLAISPSRADDRTLVAQIALHVEEIFFAHLFDLRLTYSYMGIYSLEMARAATTSDAFNAVAEPRRREILDYLAGGERSVNDLVIRLGFEQPSVSKHLRVLRNVGLVRVRRHGRQMLYQTNAEAIRPLHEWTKTFERLWSHQLTRIKERAEDKAGQAGNE